MQRQYVAITFAHFLAEHSGVFTSLRDVPAVAKILKVAWSSSSVGHASLLDELLDAHVLEKNNRTAVTPNVHHIAKRLFPAKHLRQLPATLLGDSPMIDAPTSRDSFPVHGASMRCRWVEETETIPGFYDSVIIDGVHVQVRQWQGYPLNYVLFPSRLAILFLWRLEWMPTKLERRMLQRQKLRVAIR